MIFFFFTFILVAIAPSRASLFQRSARERGDGAAEQASFGRLGKNFLFYSVFFFFYWHHSLLIKALFFCFFLRWMFVLTLAFFFSTKLVGISFNSLFLCVCVCLRNNDRRARRDGPDRARRRPRGGDHERRRRRQRRRSRRRKRRRRRRHLRAEAAPAGDGGGAERGQEAGGVGADGGEEEWGGGGGGGGGGGMRKKTPKISYFDHTQVPSTKSSILLYIPPFPPSPIPLLNHPQKKPLNVLQKQQNDTQVTSVATLPGQQVQQVQSQVWP